MTSDAQLKDFVDRVARWSGTGRMGATDVLAWRTGKSYPEVMIAFRGDALRLKRNLLNHDQPLRNPPVRRGDYVGALDRELGLLLGKPEMGQIFTVDDVGIYDLLNGVQTAANNFLADGEEVAEVTLMPKQGEPWVVGEATTSYMSSKKARPQKGRPPPLVELDIDESTRQTEGIRVPIGVDVCAVAEHLEACDRGAVVGMLADRGDSVPFMVTHSFDLTLPKFEDQAERIAACGGLAYPSLAVGQIAASTFGQVALIADIGLLLEAVKPYRGRGKWPVVLYETDAWTVRTRQIFTVGAYQMFVELTGQPADWTYKDDFWVLGVPTEEHKADVVTTTKKMRTALKRRYKIWPEGLTAAEVEERTLAAMEQEGFHHSIAVAKYPYLEAKVNAVVPMSCFPLAVVPRGQRAEAQRFLGTAGWRGDVVELDFPVFSPDADFELDGRDLRYDYGWMVGDVVLGVAQEQGRIMDVAL